MKLRNNTSMNDYKTESRIARLLGLLAGLKQAIYIDFTANQNINIIDRNLTSLEKQIKRL